MKPAYIDDIASVRKMQRYPWAKESDRATILELRAQGVTDAEIARRLGVAWESVAAASYLTGRMAAAFWLMVAGILAFVVMMLWAGE